MIFKNRIAFFGVFIFSLLINTSFLEGILSESTRKEISNLNYNEKDSLLELLQKNSEFHKKRVIRDTWSGSNSRKSWQD